MYCVTTTDRPFMCNSYIESSFQALQTDTTFHDCSQFLLQVLFSAPIPKSCSDLILITLGWGLVEWSVVGYRLQHGVFPCVLIHTWPLESDVYGAVSPTSFWWGPLGLAPSQPLFCLSLDCRKSCCCSLTTSCLTLWLSGLQHARLPCPSLSPGICWNSCPWSQCCYPTTSSSAGPFSFCLQSFPALRSFIYLFIFNFYFYFWSLFQWVSSSQQVVKVLEL